MGADEKHAATYHGREYTPTTEEVRKHWENVGFAGTGTEFDRWLETVRAEAKAEAWDEAVKWYIEKIACPRTCGDCAYCSEDDTYNPYEENLS